MIPESGWYKSVGHQLRWLHHLSFHCGGARYAASLTYFYFDRERRADAVRAARCASAGDSSTRKRRSATPYEAADGSDLDRMLYADSMVRLPNHPVMITDRICMAHGLEARSPFMDHELAQFAARLPAALKVRGGTLRYIQRKLAARYLPPQILNRPKQGFSSALPYLLQARVRAAVRDLPAHFAPGAGRHPGRRRHDALIDEHTAQRADHGNRLWLLINAEIWYRMAILGQSKEDLRRELTADGCRAPCG